MRRQFFVTMGTRNSGAEHEDVLERMNEDGWTRQGTEPKDEGKERERVRKFKFLSLGIGMKKGWIDGKRRLV